MVAVGQASRAADGVIDVDDSIIEKPYTDENDLICWHWDYSKGQPVRLAQMSA